MAVVCYAGAIGSGKSMNATVETFRTAQRRGAWVGSNMTLDPPRATSCRCVVCRERGVVYQHFPVTRTGIDIDLLRAWLREAQTTCRLAGTEIIVGSGFGRKRVAHECGGFARNGEPARLFRMRVPEPWRRCEGHGTVLLLDEVGILWPARFWQDFPIDVVQTLSQSRKGRTDFFYTTQDVELVDSNLRRLTNVVWLVKAFPIPTIERQERGARPWVFLMTKWKVRSVDKSLSKPIGRKVVRYRREWEDFYSTDEVIEAPEQFRERERARREREARRLDAA